VSSYWHPGDAIHVDLLPGLDAADWLKALKRDWPKRLVHTAMQQHLPRPLCQALVMRGWPTLSGQPLAAWPDRTLMALGQSLNDWVLRPSGTEGYRTAEVTLGGVDTDAISSRTMEVSTQPGLYFIGEVLDVTGHLGGFNFQWAWSSGFVAGKHAGAIVEK
jgi:predicted Rossmann fold flavoprotein